MVYIVLFDRFVDIDCYFLKIILDMYLKFSVLFDIVDD